MPLIKLIHAREILDSRGNPTVEVEVFTENGVYGRASVPSGASTGSHEALELRDGNKNRYLGKGVIRAVNNVNNIIAKELLSMDVRNQEEIDNKMLLLDGTENKSNLGANAILGVSLAVAHCAANYNKVNLYEYLSKAGEISLPRPMMNILNGGAHANFCIDFQEIMIIPQGMKTFKERLRCGAEVFHSLKVILKENGYYLGVGDEGGYAANLKDNEEAFILVCKAIERANYVVGKDVCLAIDAASSEFYNKESKKYFLSKENKQMNYKELVDEFYMPLIEKYPIISIEDPLAEDDVEGWQYISEKLSDRIQLVGDDLFVTNKKRLKWGIDLNIANSILIKVNQIGTLTETLQTIELAKKHNYKVIISHRSGETEDTTIADLSVATNAGQIKTGSLSRTDRIAKYNQLLRIEEEIEKRTER